MKTAISYLKTFVLMCLCIGISYTAGSVVQSRKEMQTALQANAGYYDMKTGQFRYGFAGVSIDQVASAALEIPMPTKRVSK